MPFDKADAAALTEIVRQTAKAEIMPRFRNLGEDEVRQKTSAEDLVTAADRGAEAMIRDAVLAAFPGTVVIGEESVSDDPSVLDRLAGAERAVIVDPVDGTWNYAMGLTQFGVIVAAVERGETVFGLLYDPVLDDWMSALKGEGAVYGRPGGHEERLSVSQPNGDGALGYVQLFLFPKRKRPQLATAFPAFDRIMSLRCSCHEYRMIAAGHVDFSLNGTLLPWDHAAGQLVHAEAGGYSALLDGRAYAPALREGYLLLAADRDRWQRLRDRFGRLLDD